MNLTNIKRNNKKGALELSIGTIVIIVLAMSMLILGLVLVRTIFTGAKYNVEQLNKNVEAEINKLFNERGGRTFVYLPNNEAEVDKGKSFGIAFGIKNDLTGDPNPARFNYEIKTSSIQTGCQLTPQQADSYIILGKTGSLDLVPGADPKFRLAKFQAPETAPLCEIQYDLIVTVSQSGQAAQPYDTNFFIVKIQ